MEKSREPVPDLMEWLCQENIKRYNSLLKKNHPSAGMIRALLQREERLLAEIRNSQGRPGGDSQGG